MKNSSHATRPRATGHPAAAAAATVLALLLAATLTAALAAATAVAEPAAGDESASDEPVIGRLVITGNEKTKADVIERVLGFRQGDRFPEDEIDDDWDRLEDTGFFAFVDIAWQETAPDTVEVTVTVEEEQTTRLHPLLAYSQRHKYLLGASVADANFRGRGERLQVDGTWYRVHGYEATWERPWLLGRHDLGASLTARWQTAGFVFRPTEYQDWYAAGRMRWDLRHPFFLTGELGYGGFDVMDPYSDFAVDRGHGERGLVSHPARWRERLVMTLTAGLDSRDMIYYPTRGGYHRLIVRRVEGRGFTSYSEWMGDLRQYLPTPWDHVLALHAWGRLVSGPLPLEDRLFWGGAANLRGYDYASFEGEDAYLLTAEYRWPLFLMPISPRGRVIGVGVHVFTDVGDVWFDGAEAGEARRDWGGGVHLNVSTRQLRFEVAWTQTGEARFQFLDTFNF